MKRSLLVLLFSLIVGNCLMAAPSYIQAGQLQINNLVGIGKRDRIKVEKFIRRIEKAESYFLKNKTRSTLMYLENADNFYGKMASETKLNPVVVAYKIRYELLINQLKAPR